MTQSLGVTSTYLNQLADTHDQAAADIGAAAKSSVGIGRACWTNNGVVCAEANIAITEAEAARAAAYAAAQASSTALAGDLRTSAVAYDGTDQQAATSLDQQMPTTS